MADEKPVSRYGKSAAGPGPHPATGLALNVEPATPGVTPANSPAAIPEIMRNPVTPPAEDWQSEPVNDRGPGADDGGPEATTDGGAEAESWGAESAESWGAEADDGGTDPANGGGAEAADGWGLGSAGDWGAESAGGSNAVPAEDWPVDDWREGPVKGPEADAAGDRQAEAVSGRETGTTDDWRAGPVEGTEVEGAEGRGVDSAGGSGVPPGWRSAAPRPGGSWSWLGTTQTPAGQGRGGVPGSSASAGSVVRQGGPRHAGEPTGATGAGRMNLARFAGPAADAGSETTQDLGLPSDETAADQTIELHLSISRAAVTGRAGRRRAARIARRDRNRIPAVNAGNGGQTSDTPVREEGQPSTTSSTERSLAPGQRDQDRAPTANPRARVPGAAASAGESRPRNLADLAAVSQRGNAEQERAGVARGRDREVRVGGPVAGHDAGTGPAPQGGRVRSSRGRDAGEEVLLPDLEFRPIVYVRDMAESIAFYRVLGAEVVHGEPHSEHVLLQLGTVQIRLVARAAVVGAGVVELNFTAAMPLDRLGRRLRAQRVPVDEGLDDIGFGPQLRIRTPDGVIIRIGRLEPEDQA